VFPRRLPGEPLSKDKERKNGKTEYWVNWAGPRARVYAEIERGDNVFTRITGSQGRSGWVSCEIMKGIQRDKAINEIKNLGDLGGKRKKARRGETGRKDWKKRPTKKAWKKLGEPKRSARVKNCREIDELVTMKGERRGVRNLGSERRER